MCWPSSRQNALAKPTLYTYERYLFLDRRQGASEDFEEYLTDLKAIVRRCDYGTMEDALLRDRIVHGIVCEPVRKRLLSKKDLTLEKCVALCRADAKTTSQARTMRRVSPQKQTVDELHVVRSSFRGTATRETPGGKHSSSLPYRHYSTRITEELARSELGTEIENAIMVFQAI